VTTHVEYCTFDVNISSGINPMHLRAWSCGRNKWVEQGEMFFVAIQNHKLFKVGYHSHAMACKDLQYIVEEILS
jgi:hypothetical protein